MDFFIDTHSTLPEYQQLQEQIKLALLLGRLRPGDTLPSIRDVERQARVSRNIVRKAYLALQRNGILSLRHGKGVLVEKELSYGQRNSIMEQCEELSSDILKRIEKLRISPSAFSRFLYHRARERERHSPAVVFVDVSKPLALERASRIASHWHVNVHGVSMDEFEAEFKDNPPAFRTILTNYFRVDAVRRITKRSRAEVIPLSLIFTQDMRNEFRRLPSHSAVVLVLDDRDYPALRMILDSYRQVLVDPSVKLSSMPLGSIRSVEKFIHASKFQKIIFSNRIWDSLPDETRKHPRVTRPRMEIDLSALESIRIRSGVIM